MLDLNLPPFPINVKKKGERLTVFDPLRRRYVALTPEEWVRQHFINYLITEKGYPKNLIANETEINLNSLKRRCDSVVHNKELSPIVIIEYKAPEVKITQAVFDQIARYNIVLRVKYLIVSNGIQHFCCKIDYDNQSFQYLPEIPYYTDL